MTDELAEVVALAALVEQLLDEHQAVAHGNRFRRVSNRYPRRVAEAYRSDIARAARDSDEQVAEVVAEWERSHGLAVRDWHAIGREEQDRER